MIDAFVVLGLTTAAHILLSIAVWRSHPAGRANRAFAYLALTLAAWALSNGLVRTYADTPWGIIWARAAFFSASLLPLWCFRFVTVFPTSSPQVSQRLYRVMTACAAVSCLASITPLVAQSTALVNRALHMTYGPLYPV